ncbi:MULTISPECIES: FAD-binding oxidoreductase [unclassified Tenacibaculum]|uniref:FAD-binding oxidoreductase n=1 Tax=unclassified Tenacibaculum TaxID=2635139 RepID=UPI001F44ABD0|nr:MULTISPECIES: FAD-dependent oxidoreductase [unclassified Tenacibaculum]MCF2873098.1 FAD-dependent oxidoreductase [Tenacibaculum sp. Cn5-1]MCF2933254.1 FAD-dependent oxidoreductase [Tenacibaculum sp. Cn5-34]MCG7510165.1 FAD-dependent oxidoreductase [Tenacibaculum sp. Cn5-46]
MMQPTITIQLKEQIDSFLKELNKIIPSNVTISTNWGDLENVYEHNLKSQIFNRRLQFNPFVIVYCETASDVEATYNTAIKNKLPIKVRAGGHDHEGECNGTNVVLIDVSKMNRVSIDPNTKIAKIGPGIRFESLTSILADNNVMIPHGTCATVGIAGFTMGGGWGPWTRKMGMCCEHLVGATILLGNGKLINLNANPETGSIPDLLWALRGGGGMSYGIVTELRIQTFPLPKVLHRFEIEWNPYSDQNPDSIEENVPTIQVLKKWEELITSKNTPRLTGTNLKINGRSWDNNTSIDTETIAHNCVFYGYWEGDETSLTDAINDNFTGVLANYEFTIEPATGADFHHKNNYGKNLMSNWDRESHSKILSKLNLLQGTPLQPDEDLPAPHKITSRLVDKNGLDYNDKNGYQQLLKSLTSSLILDGNRALGLFNYVTLGAIVGDFYTQKSEETNSAFPYKDKLYTIQYQCWWNTEIEEKEEFQDNFVYDRTNRALDWIEASRDFDIPNTSGAFISFKDSSIPTKTYFDKSYKRLIEIKENESKDPYNHFRTRKTII